MVAATLVAVTGSSGTADMSVRAASFPCRTVLERGSAEPEYDAKAVMVKFKPKATTSARKAAVAKVGARRTSPSPRVVKVKGDLSAPELLKKVKADPAVELASLNYKRQQVRHSERLVLRHRPEDLPEHRPGQRRPGTCPSRPAARSSPSSTPASTPVTPTWSDTWCPATTPPRQPRGPIDDNGHGTHDARHHRGRRQQRRRRRRRRLERRRRCR